MAEPALKLVETNEVETKALTIVDQAKAVKVIDGETYTSAGLLWKAIGDMIAEVKSTFDPICDAAHKAHKTATEKRSKYLDPLQVAYKSVKSLMSDYDAEQKRKAEAEQRRLEALAKKEEEDRLIAEAAEMEKNGQHEEAAAIIEEPVYVPPITVKKDVPKMAGGPVYRTIWKFKIYDAKLIPREYLIPDEKSIGGVVRASQGKIKIPGIQSYEERC